MDSLKTTHVRILGNSFRSSPSDRAPKDSRNPVQWGVLFPDHCSLRHSVNAHGLFGGVGSAGRCCGQGGEGQYFY